jgi:N-acetylmuramoyl-L-alanine amidase
MAERMMYMSKKVFLGVGHGGSDPGAIGINGIHEADLNLDVALACNNELVRHGVSVMMSRTKNENDTLEQEIAECLAYRPSLAIDIHHNAGGGDGVEVFHSYGYAGDDVFAKNVIDEIVAIGQNSRGLKTKRIDGTNRDWFGFIRQINETLHIPSILVECAFVDTKDVEIVDTPEERKKMGIAIAKAILKTLGIAYIEPSVPVAGKTVYFKGGKHYTSANGNTGYEVKAGPAKITNYVAGAKHPYHVIHTDNTSTVYGWVNANTIETMVTAKAPEVGDVVNFAGGKHYISSNSGIGYKAKGGKAKITRIVKNAKHPYHLVRVSGGTSTVYGWVNTDTIK